jgi:sugar phosphate isomerase/epimerase
MEVLAAKSGLKLTVEFTPRTAIKSLEQALEFVRASGASGVTVDALHFFRTGGDLMLLRNSAALLCRAQICDGPMHISATDAAHEAIYERAAPGCGEFPLIDFVSALPPDLVLGIECPSIRQMNEGQPPSQRIANVVLAARDLLGKTA